MVTKMMWRQTARLLVSLLVLTSVSAQLSEDAQVQTILGPIYTTGLIFNGHFTTNPATALGPLNYQWLEYESATSPNNQHKGILKFNGSATSYVDMGRTTGPNSVGIALPTFGGASLGTGDRQGVTFEVVVKFDAVANWAKIFILSDPGTRINEFQLCWDGDSDNMNRLLFQQYINVATVGTNFDKGLFETFRPALGVWYHIALVLKPVTLDATSRLYGAGTWYLYVNGNQLALADALSPGAAFTSTEAANYPLRVARNEQYIAKSKYSDPYAQFSMDAMRVYDVALTSGEISQLANIYGLNLASYALPTPALNKVIPSSPENTKHRTSFINFDPVYRLDFASNVVSLVGGTIDYAWMQFDNTDTAEDQALHTGLVKFANDNAYIDLMADTGPKSAGLVMPTLFGQSSGTGTSYGWSFDLVFKPQSVTSWAKLFSLGTGPYYDALYAGWRGGDNFFEAGNYNVLRDDMINIVNPAVVPFYRSTLFNKWCHLAWVIEPLVKTPQPLTSYNASWSLYVNGQRTASTIMTMNMPLAVVRRYSTLGSSNWADPKARMVVDAFRIWDRALNADQVESLSTAYGVTPVDGGDWAWQQALGTARQPVYNLDFQANPTQNSGQGPISWGWTEQDPDDSIVVAGQHTGLAVLDGTANSYISLNSITGPNRVYDGLSMPSVGGPTTPGAGYQSGWSFEACFKATGFGSWAKLFALSNGRDVDEIMFGYDGSDMNMVVQNYIDDNAYNGNWAYAITEVVKPTKLNQWYHVVITMQPGSVEGAGNWKVFVNGQAQAWADRITPGMTFTELQGASYPRAVSRGTSWLGKSNFADPNMKVIIDAFRIYDYVLTPAQVSSFATAYACNTPMVIPTPANNQPFPSVGETTNWQTAGLSTTPQFNGVFAQNPASFVGGTIDYQWLEFDPNDTPAQQLLHRGIVVFNGSDSSYADLTLPTGPKSVGLIMPIIGGVGSGSGTARGMTIEMVVKLLSVKTWAKLIELSTGPDIDSLVFGWNNDRYNTIELSNFNAIKPGLNRRGGLDIIYQPPIGRWLHIACSLRLTDDARYDAEYTCYIDGEVVARKTSDPTLTYPANFPLPVYRQNTFLAKSAWNDPTAAMMVDMVRVHDYAFTQAQIRSSANQYGLYGAVVPSTNTTLPFPPTDESTAAARIVTKQPVFNAWFGSDPNTLVQAPLGLDYTWVPTDTADSSTDQQKHRGIAKFTGAATSFVDVNTNTGPNSCGVVLPDIGGAGSGTGASQGWTFEVVFKLSQLRSWAKLFDFGNGPDIGNILIGVEGTDITTMNVDVFDNARTEYPHGLAELFKPELNKWYHVVWQIAPVNMTAGSANYFFYVNGQQLAYTDQLYPGSAFTPVQGASYPGLFKRRFAYVSRSNWGDPLFEGSMDALRIYDYLVPASQISQLADLYGCLDNSAVLPTPALNKPVNPSTVAETRAWNHDGIVEPVFNANFGMDPRSLVGGTNRYTWMETDSTDSESDRQVHKGLISLDGTDQAFIDLMTADGPNSIGLVLPTIFGSSSGTRNEKGWTVELVTKIGRAEIWSKLINFATGGSDWMDSFALSWNGDFRGQVIVQNFNNLNPVATSPSEVGTLPFMMNPTLNRWYHITLVMQPTKPLERFGAVWRMYVDGSLVNRTTTTGNYPLAVARGNSFIAASQWGLSATNQNSMMVVDALRIYDRALLPTQVASLARMYNFNPTVTAEPDLPDWINEPVNGGSTGGNGGSSSGGSSGGNGSEQPGSSSSSSSKLSDGAIAGIVIGSVVGVFLLCAVVFCLCCGKMSMSNKKASGDDMNGTGRYGEVEPSQSSHEVEMEETA